MITFFKAITNNLHTEIKGNINKLTTVLNNISEFAQTLGNDKTDGTRDRFHKMRDMVCGHLRIKLAKFEQIEPTQLITELAPRQFLQGFNKNNRSQTFYKELYNIDIVYANQTKSFTNILNTVHDSLTGDNKQLEYMNSNLRQLNQHYETIYLRGMTKILTRKLSQFTPSDLDMGAKAFVDMLAKDYSTAKLSKFVKHFHKELDKLLHCTDKNAYQKQLVIVNKMREQKAIIEANNPWSIIVGDPHLCQASKLAAAMLEKTPKKHTIENHKAFIEEALDTLPKIFSLVETFSKQTVPKTIWKDTLGMLFVDDLEQGEKEIQFIGEKFTAAFPQSVEPDNSQTLRFNSF